jgi:hypothetical protein
MQTQHSKKGRPRKVISQGKAQIAFTIAKLEQELANRDEEAWNLVRLAPEPTAGMAKERRQSQIDSIACNRKELYDGYSFTGITVFK